MFDSLSEKLQGTLAGVRQRGALTEEDISRAMREIRLALLEADVNFKVVKQFTSTVKERALGIEVHAGQRTLYRACSTPCPKNFRRRSTASGSAVP